MALYLPSLSFLLLLFFRSSTAFWCVARFDVTSQALQAALDYACAAGADCAPIQPNGLCFLPNTLPAHASYAFNSYFQRRGMAPGSCNFAGTSTIAKTDPIPVVRSSLRSTNLASNLKEIFARDTLLWPNVLEHYRICSPSCLRMGKANCQFPKYADEFGVEVTEPSDGVTQHEVSGLARGPVFRVPADVRTEVATINL